MASSSLFAVVVVALAVLSQASSSSLARVARDTPTVNLQDFANSIRNQLETVGAEVTKAVRGEEGAVTADEVKTFVEARTQELQERSRAFTEEVSRQLESRRSEMSESMALALQQAAQHVNTSIERVQELARNSPSAAESFNQSFKTAVETLIEENSKLARAAGDDASDAHNQLATLTRNTMTQAMNLVNNLASEMQNAAARTSS